MRMDKTFILCSHAPRCILLWCQRVSSHPFPGIDADCVPIFPITFPVRIGEMWITRTQIPVSPAFALTEYKVQGFTYQSAILDLSWKSPPRGRDAMHKRYSSNYVQITRLGTKSGIQLVQPVTMDDLNNKMHPELEKEFSRLEVLACETLRSLSANYAV
jgi:hypothetical protein